MGFGGLVWDRPEDVPPQAVSGKAAIGVGVCGTCETRQKAPSGQRNLLGYIAPEGAAGD
jgi:hypothetical protein